MRYLYLTTIILLATSILGYPQDNKRGYLVNTGDMAPDFVMELTDGSLVKLSDLKGKVVMLQFTASWCGVCRKEIPHIEKEIWQELKDNPNFALLAIDRDEPKETIEKYWSQLNASYPIGMDPEANIFKLYAKEKAGITRNVIIDKSGKIVYLTRLFNPEEFNGMKKVILKLLEE